MLSAQTIGFASLLTKGKAVFLPQNTRLYADSSFSKPTEQILSEGSVAELLHQTNNLFPDNAQKQLFKWYKIKSDTKEGWVFGDEALLIVPYSNQSPVLQSVYLKKINLGRGFEETMVWVARIEGSDLPSKKLSQSPLYQESYLVMTPKFGKSLSLPIELLSSGNTTKLSKLFFKDITQDDFVEIAIELEHFQGNEHNKEVLVYSVQSGAFQKIWEENLSVSGVAQYPSFKQVNLQSGTIRESYLDLKDCPTQNCSSLKTKTLRWNSQSKHFEEFYPESSIPLKPLQRDGAMCCLLKKRNEWIIRMNTENSTDLPLKQITWKHRLVEEYFQHLLSESLDKVGGIEIE